MNLINFLKKKYASVVLSLIFVLLSVQCQCFGQKQIVYKQVDTTRLTMQVYFPDKMDTTKRYPALVFFFGGGWINGGISQFENQAKYFAKKRMICFLIDYRVKSRQKTTPFESLKDAKSAIRFIRENSNQLFVDPVRIVAAGASAGGQLAAATVIKNNYNEKTDNINISSIPNALILFNPVIDNGPSGYGFDIIGDAYKNFSPLHNIKKGMPPTLIMLGTKDKFIPEETALYYKKAMERVGSRCDLILYKNREHGFFNYKNRSDYNKTLKASEKFLISLGYIK